MYSSVNFLVPSKFAPKSGYNMTQTIIAKFSCTSKLLSENYEKNVGEWWKKDVMKILQEFLKTGGDPNVSDAFTINGQPGGTYPCSKSGVHCLNYSILQT